MILNKKYFEYQKSQWLNPIVIDRIVIIGIDVGGRAVLTLDIILHKYRDYEIIQNGIFIVP